MPNKKIKKIKNKANSIITLEKLAAIMVDGFTQAKQEREEGLTQVRKEMEIGFTQAKQEREEGLTQVRKEMEIGFTQAKQEREEGFAQAKKDNEDLALMVKQGFDEVNSRLILLERSQRETNDRLELSKHEQEEIKLRLTNVAYRFEFKELEEKVMKMEDIVLARRRKL